ncbi:hypothetical protein [Nostoc sp. NMS8]|uniref:hypothetical protein n=1 Tax=Nostoc sp. NMS8 TaxID=2815392 RepID=UPI0025CF4E8D|nr:hypothetical protein [Nostoc sp. NMS8]MBN3959639.1 hypothetical protein [Nostoc sp. NMS8]
MVIQYLICKVIRGKVTEAVTKDKVACNFYATNVSAFIMIEDSDHPPLLKSFDLSLSRNYEAKM